VVRADRRGGAVERVLYVDADEALAERVRTRLTSAESPLCCTIAVGADEALSTLEADGTDCLVTAFALGEDTAFDLIDRVRESWADLPVVLFSEHPSLNQEQNALDAGFADYVEHRSDEQSIERLATRVRHVASPSHTPVDAELSGRRLRRTLERTTDGVFAVDHDWRIEYYNDRMGERIGVGPEQLVGEVLWDSVPALVDTPYEAHLRAAAETGDPVEFEQYLGDSFDYWVEVRAFPDEEGMTVFSRQISDRRERELELERSETILRNVHDVVLAVDDDLTVTFANPAAARVFGQNHPSKLTSSRLRSLVEDRTPPRSVTELETAIVETFAEMASDGGATGIYDYDLQFGLRTAAGQRQFDVRLAPFAATLGRQVLVVARDVTTQSAAQRQLERERDALQGLQAVMADASLTHETRLTDLLAHGCETLGLDVGIVSRVERDEYEVDAVYAPGMDIEVGDRFDVGSSFCAEVVESDSVRTFVDTDRDGETDHPVYQSSGLGSYIGVPLVVDGERFGTLNFSSPEPRPHPFGELERTFVELLAELISTERSRIGHRRHLEATNQRLSTLIESAPLAVLELDERGTVLRWSRGAEEMFGWSGDEVVGDRLPFVPEENQAEFEALLQQVVAGNRIRGRPIRRERKDGTAVDLRLSTAPLWEPDGTLSSILAVLDDVTGMKRLETNLRALQTTARRLNAATTTEEIGEIAVETAAEVLGLEITGIWEYDERAAVLEPITETQAARDHIGSSPRFSPGEGLAWNVFESGEMEVRYDVDSDQERYNAETPISSEILVPLGTRGLMVTGTVESRLFTDVEIDLFAILAGTVETALARAEREELLRQQNERLDEFASVVAHDLRNPLTVAMGFLELASTTGEEAHFDRVEQAHDRIEHLIADLLTLARGESVVADPETRRLETVVEDAWRHVETGTATLSVVGDLPTVDCNPGRLTQLFENLFRNSVEHGSTGNRMQSGDSVEHGSTSSRPEADDSVDHAGSDFSVTVGTLGDGNGFFVEDDGEGIPADRRETVFDHGVSYSRSGTGFGLSIVQAIAREHGWSVSLTEGSAGGARFEFAFDDRSG
jgi:PAS domain S-box-containing protein